MSVHPAEPSSGKSNTLLIALVAGIALLAVCACVGFGGIAMLGVGGTTPERPAPILEPSAPTDNGDGGDVEDGAVINLDGSAADATLRNDVLRDLRGAMETPDCPLSVEEANVVSGPDDSGVWVESWLVSNCNGISTLTITFTPDSTGTTYTVQGQAPGQ